MASSASKKRKRNAGADDNNVIVLQKSTLPEAQPGPVLVSFPALQPPAKTAYQCYRHSGQAKGAGDKEFALQNTLIGGEADTVDFLSATQVDREEAGCSYYVAVHNKRTKVTTFRPAPLHLLQRQVKALKGIEPAPVSAAERLVARNQLGYAFGTKKAQAQIRAQERNRVDASAMEEVSGALQARIEANTKALPSKEEAVELADSARLIPKYNPDATDAAHVYALNDIIPDAELSALDVRSILNARATDARTKLLPYGRSNWVNQHLFQLCSAPKPNKLQVKIVVYIATLFAFRAVVRKQGDRQALQEKLGVPPTVVDGLLERFTESARGANKVQSTSQTETKLLTYMFALCLRVDDYATDTSLIADDLSMPVAKVNTLFKTLGCRIDKLSPAMLKQLGLPDSAALTKRAVLNIPLEFPKPRVKRKTGGR